MPQKVGMPWSPGLRLSMLIGVLIAGMLFGVFLSGTGVMGQAPSAQVQETRWLLVDELVAKDAIREQLFNYVRGLDRMDKELTLSMSHPGATINAGTYEGTFAGYIERAWVGHARLTAHSHQITTISIKVDGDTAVSEGYAMNSLHSEPTPPDSANANTNLYCQRYVDR